MQRKFLVRLTTVSLMVCVIFTNLTNPAFASQDAKILQRQEMSGSVQGYPIWRGSVPTEVSIPVSYAGSTKPCGNLIFNIEAVAPSSELLNRATGIDVDFEIWSNSGAKIGSAWLYSGSWNPVSTTNQVKIFLCDDNSYGTHTLLVKNKRTISTTGLLSRYLEDKMTSQITIIKPAPLPKAPGKLNYSWSTGKFTFKAPTSSVTGYEVLLATSLTGVKPPSKNGTVLESQFEEMQVVKQIPSSTFTLTKSEIAEFIPKLNSMILIKIRALNNEGNGPTNTGLYVLVKDVQKSFKK